ncbi:hypothetical protein [Mangrovicoccus ximenensis]|uniref:hypothetical protein n=1 Tax=Mangrovicoccus ximenensis TaxID=1911570 RepID=UPI00137515B4|nr:hypothetical protein [Mangrovicoccus ximenensis]
MSRIFVIGATGGVGHRLVPLLTGAGYGVSGLHRKPEQADALRAASRVSRHSMGAGRR